MNFNCIYDNINEVFDCTLPDVFNTVSSHADAETLTLAENDFKVEEIVSYGDLTISFFIFLILLIYIFEIILKYFIIDTVRIKKHEL